MLGPDSTTLPFVARIKGGGIVRSMLCCGGVLLAPVPELQGELAALGGALWSRCAKLLVCNAGRLIRLTPSDVGRDWSANLTVFSLSSLLQNAQRIFLNARIQSSASPSRLPSFARRFAAKKQPSRTSDASNSNNGPSKCCLMSSKTRVAISRHFRSASAYNSRTCRT